MTDTAKLRSALHRLVRSLETVSPITTNETPDYAELSFGTHQTQAMTMVPKDWSEVANAYCNARQALSELNREGEALTALFEAISDADDRVFQARETLDQYADDEPDDNTCATVRDDSQQLHDAWKAVKAARDKAIAALTNQGEGS